MKNVYIQNEAKKGFKDWAKIRVRIFTIIN